VQADATLVLGQAMALLCQGAQGSTRVNENAAQMGECACTLPKKVHSLQEQVGVPSTL
jgi:hypothetical protein